MGTCFGDNSHRMPSQEPSQEPSRTGPNYKVPNYRQSLNPPNKWPVANPTKLILRPILPKDIPQATSNPTLLSQIKPLANQFIEVKVPTNMSSWTEFKWVKEPLYFIPDTISNMSPEEIKCRSFQQKLKWFRVKLEKKRISWDTQKSQYLEVDRQNILMSSKNQFQKINFHKEVKIVFKDEKIALDAGGLMRQWMNMCIKEIFDPSLGMFKLCDSSTTYYKFYPNEQVIDLFEVASEILGVVIGKAIFQRIPLSCPLNYTILRQLSSQPIQMNDIFTYDQDFYKGWDFTINNVSITTMEQNFCVYEFDQHGTQITIPLKENGFDIMVNSENKEEFVTLSAQYYCTKSIQKLLQKLKYGLYKVIPAVLLSVFNPHELDVIINGRSQIDISDLKQHTVYSGYTVNDQVIVWFWEFIYRLGQEQLSKLLHFVTGNGRVPILGFKYLQSNRGAYQQFHIKEVQYDEKNPYPKSHTCFNRLELPKYPNIDLFNKYIEYVTYDHKGYGLQ